MLDDLDSGSAIAAEVSRLLRVADVKERLPTPVDDLVAAADLRKVAKIDIDEAMVAAAPTAEMRRILGGAMRKIRGLLDRRDDGRLAKRDTTVRPARSV